VTAGLAAAYPVGSIYISTVSTNPNTLFGFGTWVAYGQGRMLISQDGTYTAGSTGGAATTTLITANLPAHSHTATVTDPGHFHSYARAANTQPQSGSSTQCLVSNTTDNTSTATTGITVTNSSTGSGTAVTTISPYIAVYMWNRTV
jgi:microcystin-dependent protein